MAKLWTVTSAGNLTGARLQEYSDEQVAMILDTAKDYVICYDWSEEKDNWDDERGSGSYGGIGYFRISENHVLVCGGKAIGVIFKMKKETYGRFTCGYGAGNHFILFGSNKTLCFNCSYYVGSTDVSEKNLISLVKASSLSNESISTGRMCLTGLTTDY